MQWSFDPPTPLSYFAQLVASDDELPLFEAAASLVSMDEGGVIADMEGARDAVDRLAVQLKQGLSFGSSELKRLQALNQFFFQDMGFGVNQTDFYDPRNSMLPHVLQTRQGIPVSLAVIWLELAHGLGLKAMGVGFPGHFLVSVRLNNGLVVIDPATGASLGRDQLSEHLDGLACSDETGRMFRLDVDACLKPSTPREVLARMLRNLMEIQVARRSQTAQLAVLDRLIILLPKKADLRCERGLLLAEMQRNVDALDDLAWYLQQTDLETNPQLREQAQAWISQFGKPLP